MSSLLTRVLTAAVALPILLGAVWLGGPVLVGVAALGVAAGVHEFIGLSPAPVMRRQAAVAMALGLLLLVLASRDVAMTPAILLAGMGAGLAVSLIPPRSERAWIAWAWASTGALYVALPLALGVALRDMPDGRNWVFLALLATFATDTAAYAVGRLFGRHRMAPSVSPRKTWEGAAGGLVAGGVATAYMGTWVGLAPWQGALLGAGLALAAMVGDLAESLLKREAGVKDAGGLFPGHGGMLDRLDSIVFVLPAVYAIARMVSR